MSYPLPIQIAAPLAFALAAAFSIAVAAEQPVRWEFPVQGEYRPVNSSRATITGELPLAWEDDSAWADVAVHYRAQTINPFSGDRSLRVEVRAVRAGTVQFRVRNVAADPGRALRIRTALRSEDGATVQLALRKRGAPYTTYWETSFAARPEWGEQEALAIVQAQDPEAVLMFSLNAPGALEVGSLEVESVALDVALAGLNFEGNLLYTSVFPLGLSAPWAIGAEGTTAEHVRPDPAMPGPSGLPALRLVAHRYERRPMMQITSPFIGRPNAVHTFSLWARAEKAGQTLYLRLGPPREQLWRPPWQAEVKLTEQWHRYELSVLLPPAPDLVYLARITSHDEGVFWVDQLQVEVADQAGPYRRTGQVEVHAVAGKDWGLSIEDEPLNYVVAVVGNAGPGARVEGSVLDLYDVERPLPPLQLSENLSYQRFDVALPSPAAYGSFLVTLQAKDAEGRPISRPAELLLHRVCRPRFWARTSPESMFGVHVPATESAVRMAKALGFNWNRMHYGFTWSGLQDGDGTWRFERLDRALAIHAKERVLILGHFGGVPPKYSVAGPKWEGANPWFRTTAAPRADAMDAFEDYCRRVLSRAGDGIPAMETWNEPFLPGFFVGDVREGRPIRERPEVLVEIHRRARSAATATGWRGLLLWNVGPHYGESELKFDEAVRDGNGASYVDGVSFHRYANSGFGVAGDQLDRDVTVIRKTFAQQDILRHIWNSEGGHGLSEVFNLYRQIPPARGRQRAESQASQYVRYFLSNFAAGAEKVFIYTFFPMDRWTAEYGYLNVDGRLSQIAPAASCLAWHVDGKRFSQRRQVAEGVYAHEFRGESENTVVLLPTGGGGTLQRLPAGVRAADIYGNPPSLPYPIRSGVLYLTAPGLTLDHVAAIFAAGADGDLPVIVPPTAPSGGETAPAASARFQKALWWAFGAVFVLVLLAYIAARRSRS